MGTLVLGCGSGGHREQFLAVEHPPEDNAESTPSDAIGGHASSAGNAKNITVCDVNTGINYVVHDCAQKTDSE